MATWSTGTSLVGPRGLSTRYGLGAPTTSYPTQQRDGDSYINVSTGDLYGRSGGTWTLQINLVGATGAQGPGILLVAANPNTTPPSPTPPVGTLALTTDGQFTLYGPSKADGSYATIGSIKGAIGATGPGLLVGTGAPGPNDGIVGSTYIDKTNNFLYGAKTAAGWPVTPNSITGASGPPGLPGAAGVGTQGIQGPSGLSILTGSGPPAANVGVVGQPGYYDTANAVIYPQKTGATWGTGVSLVGIQGNPGNNGTSTPNSMPFGYYWNTSYSANVYGTSQRTIQSTGGGNGTAPEEFTFPYAGYLSAVSLRVDGSSTGDNFVQVLKNGNVVGSSKVGTGVGKKVATFASTTYTFAAGDYMGFNLMNTVSGNFQCLAFATIMAS